MKLFASYHVYYSQRVQCFVIGNLVNAIDNLNSNVLDLCSLEIGLYKLLFKMKKNLLRTHFILNR